MAMIQRDAQAKMNQSIATVLSWVRVSMLYDINKKLYIFYDIHD